MGSLSSSRLVRFGLLAAFSLAAASALEAQELCEAPLPGLTDCVRDRDCVYWNQAACCPCESGGQEIAINKAQRGELLARQAQCCAGTGCATVYLCAFEPTARCENGTCTLGRCGDSVVDAAGEDCDDGGVSADCDIDCTAAQCGDGTVNALAGESCDDGNTADGDGCSATCQCSVSEDVDLDGIGDGCDACIDAAGASASVKIALGDVGADLVQGDDSLKLAMDLTLGLGSAFADLDPSASGVTLIVRSGSGAERFSLRLPSGDFDGVSGWKLNGSGSVWRYRDRSSEPTVNGVVVAQVKDRSAKSPRSVSVKIKGRGGDYPAGPFDVPLRVLLSFDDEPGHCAEARPDRTNCKVDALGTKVRCK